MSLNICMESTGPQKQAFQTHGQISCSQLICFVEVSVQTSSPAWSTVLIVVLNTVFDLRFMMYGKRITSQDFNCWFVFKVNKKTLDKYKKLLIWIENYL